MEHYDVHCVNDMKMETFDINYTKDLKSKGDYTIREKLNRNAI